MAHKLTARAFDENSTRYIVYAAVTILTPTFSSPIRVGEFLASGFNTPIAAANVAPAPGSELANLTLAVGASTGNTVQTQFSDMEDSNLRYSVVSSRENVVAASVDSAGLVTLQPRGVGRATITVTATDTGNLTATQSFIVTVPLTDGELADSALPQIVGAIQNTIADNIGARVQNVRNDQNATGLRGFWGVGNSQTLDGESNGVKWDGSLSGFSLGADTVLANGNLLGLAFNKQSGEFDVTQNAATSTYDLNMSTFSPYFGGKFRGLDYHASANFGSGEFGAHDLSSSGVAFGGERLFRENRFGTQNLKGDFLYSNTSVGDASFSSGRLRAILEQQKQQSENLQLSGEISGRLDIGGASGFGVEAVGGVRHAKGKLAIDGQIRTLLFHSESVGEFGLQVRIQVTPGQDGQGLSLSLTPSYGESESNLENLWEYGFSQTIASNHADYDLRINTRLGFGLRFAIAGLVTPYATARYDDTSRFGVGLNWKPKVRNLELDLLGEQFDTQQRVLLKGSLGF